MSSKPEEREISMTKMHNARFNIAVEGRQARAGSSVLTTENEI